MNVLPLSEYSSEHQSCKNPEEISPGMALRRLVACSISRLYSENSDKSIAKKMVTFASRFGNVFSFATHVRRCRILLLP